MMVRLRFLTLLLIGFCSSTAVAATADRCERLQAQFEAETPGSDFDYRRWIAAFEDLRHVTQGAANEKLKKREMPYDQFHSIGKALDCLDTEIHLKADRPAYDVGLKLKNAGCRNDKLGKFRSDSEANTLRHWEKESARACAGVDREHVAQLWKQLEATKADKAANEQKETPAIKQVDASLKGSEFCQKIGSVSASAPTLFKTITGAKLDKNFIEPSKSLGLPQIKLSDMVDIDMYKTPIAVSLDFLSAQPECEIWVGTAPNITTRLPPQYYCQWKYEKIARRDLEQKADKFLNFVRGCYREVSEQETDRHRHLFVGDGVVEVEGDAYFGEGKPSSIYLHLKKYTPDEDSACTRYAIRKTQADRDICMRKYIR